MKKTAFLLATLFVAASSFISCTKEEIIAQTQSDTTAVGVSASIEAANTLDIQTAIQINTKESVVTKMATASTTCAVITVDNADTYPKIFTVDYGTAGCTIGQITRKGKLKVTVSAPIFNKDSKMTIERINYYINGMKLEGTIDYVNTTANDQIPQWTRTVKNGKITYTNGKVFLNSGSYTMQQTGGVATPLVLSDNIYSMTAGSHTVTNEAGNTLTLTVQETLVKKYSCEYISKGKLKIVGGLLNGVIDYGNGDCDINFTYTHENGLVYELKM